MLSDAERQVLKGLEAELCRDDPELALALLRLVAPAGARWVRISYDAVLALATLGALVCLLLYHAGSGPAGLAAAGFALLTRTLRNHRFPPRRPGQPR